jgi:hypothetical protein
MEIKMFPASKIKQRLGLEHGGVVQKFFTNTCYKHMDKYVPKDEGNLRIIVSMDINGNKITYQSPYARYQYHGMREDGTHVVKNYTTPGTGPYWDKRMWSAEKDKVIRETQKYLRGKL